MQAPIRDGKIKMADAIDFVAEIVYPDKVKSDKDTRRKAKKAVREQIRRAFIKSEFGRLRYSDDAELEASEFFMWARKQKKWHALFKTEGLPLHFRGQMSAQESDDTMHASGNTVPPPDELREGYKALQKELWECKQYIEAIKPDLEELAERRRKEQKLKAKLSEAGREGGRSKTK
jgi:hypothetical protein